MVSVSSSTADLGTRSIRSLLVQYSVPAIIASVATSVYNIIDSIFIGRGVGPMAISGLAITFPMMNLVIAFCMFVAVGGATVSSIFLGQKNYKRASDVVNNVFFLCIIHSVVFGGLSLVFLDEILIFFGATEQTIPYAREFMQVILLGTPIAFVFIGLNNVMRATGYPRKAMISALLSVVVNVALCPLLIFVFHWGIKGAAMATVCGMFVAGCWNFYHFLSPDTSVRLNFHNPSLSWGVIKKIYAIGLSPFLMNVCACVVVVFINRSLLNWAGADGNLAVGAYGILNRTTMFFVMIVFGVTQGMQPILGFNYGAGNWHRVLRTLNIGIWVGVVVTVVGWLLTELIPDQISQMFTTDRQMIDIARRGFRIYFILYPVVGAQIVIQNFFQSVGKPKLSILLSLTRQLAFLIPFLLILPHFFKVDGVWASMAASDWLAFVLAFVILHFMKKSEEKKRAAAGVKTPEIS